MSDTLRDMVRSAQERLRAAGIESAAQDAPLIAAQAAGVARDRLAISMGDRVDQAHWRALDALIRGRIERRPVSHLLGYRDFFDHRFEVSPQVLDPRPETEVLVLEALRSEFTCVLDLGTGSGAILISLLAARPEARGVGSDLSRAALTVAQRNAARLGVVDRCDFTHSDWFDGVDGRFDLIVSNPPYIAADEMAALAPELNHEPRMALTDEGDGLGAYRVISRGAAGHLVPGGRLLVEIGPTQGQAVAGLLREGGLENIRVHPDLEGRERVVTGNLPRDRA